MVKLGVVYVATGNKAINELYQSIKSLRLHNDLPVTVISNQEIPHQETIIVERPGRKARWAKLSLGELTPYDKTLYLDADTRIHGDLSTGFDILDDWDMAIAFSTRQGNDCLGHLSLQERLYTQEMIGAMIPLNLQAGVFYFNKSEQVLEFFNTWRNEWLRYHEFDQGAFLRALAQCPLRLWLLGRDFNGGQLVEHRFGAAR